MPEPIPPNKPDDDHSGKNDTPGDDQTNEIPEHLRAELSSRRPLLPGEDSVARHDQTEMQKLDRRVDEARNDPATPIAANYKLLDHIGQGTFGTVYEAINVVTEEHVAIKFFLRGGLLESVIDETRMLGKLAGCTGIMGYKEVNWTSEDPYYVMSLATGGSLSEYLRETPPDPRTAVRLFEQIIEAMAFVHAKGVIHCDLKPGNILLSEDGHPLIADFGQSHLATNISPALGTFFYMAPEQANLEATVPDTRWDVYALGAILHELLVGEPPRSSKEFRDGLAELRTAHTKERLKYYRLQAPKYPIADLIKLNPKIDPPLARIVEACLEINPERRPQNAGDIREMLLRRRQFLKNKPLIRGAIQATAITLAGIALLSYLASDRIVNEAKQDLGVEIHGSLEYTAYLGGQLLEEKLRDRMEYLVDEAKKIEKNESQLDKLRSARDKYLAALKVDEKKTEDFLSIVSHEERLEIGKMLEKLDSGYRGDKVERADLEGNKRSASNKGSVYLFTLNADNRAFHLVLCDEQGKIQTRLDTYKQNWAWRDYFNGTGDKEDKTARYAPLIEPHFTDFYVSKRDNQSVIDLSVAIVDPKCAAGDPNRILGMLITSMKRDRDLTRWLTGKKMNATGDEHQLETTDFAVVIRRQDRLQYETLNRIVKVSNEQMQQSELIRRIVHDEKSSSAPMVDPAPIEAELSHPSCIASWNEFFPENKQGASDRKWFFVVKRSLNGVGGKSFNSMRRKMTYLGLILLSVIVGAAVLSWYWLLRLLHAGDSLMTEMGAPAVHVPMDTPNSALTPRHHKAQGGSNSPSSKRASG